DSLQVCKLAGRWRDPSGAPARFFFLTRELPASYVAAFAAASALAGSYARSQCDAGRARRCSQTRGVSHVDHEPTAEDGHALVARHARHRRTRRSGMGRLVLDELRAVGG